PGAVRDPVPGGGQPRPRARPQPGPTGHHAPRPQAPGVRDGPALLPRRAAGEVGGPDRFHDCPPPHAQPPPDGRATAVSGPLPPTTAGIVPARVWLSLATRGNGGRGMSGLHFSCGDWMGSDKSADPLFDIIPKELKEFVREEEQPAWKTFLAAFRRQARS